MNNLLLTAVETQLDFYEFILYIFNVDLKLGLHRNKFLTSILSHFLKYRMDSKHPVEILTKNVGLLKYFNIQDGASVFL